MVSPHLIHPAAHLSTAQEDGGQEVNQLALRHVIGAQEICQDDDDLSFSPEGWARFRALMAQAEESIRADSKGL